MEGGMCVCVCVLYTYICMYTNKGPSSQSYGFSSSHVWTWELDHKESWALKNWRFWTVVLGRLLRVPWTARRSNLLIQPVIPTWIFIGRTDSKAETPILWPPTEKNWLLGKDPDSGKDWRQERGEQMMRWLDGITDSMHMSLSNSRYCRWTGRPGVLQSRGCKQLDTTEQLNWNFILWIHV